MSWYLYIYEQKYTTMNTIHFHSAQIRPAEGYFSTKFQSKHTFHFQWKFSTQIFPSRHHLKHGWAHQIKMQTFSLSSAQKDPRHPFILSALLLLGPLLTGQSATSTLPLHWPLPKKTPQAPTHAWLSAAAEEVEYQQTKSVVWKLIWFPCARDRSTF